MAELPDLLEMAFPDFKIPRNIILGFTKLVYGINYGLKFFLEMYGIGENCKSFLLFV